MSSSPFLFVLCATGLTLAAAYVTNPLPSTAPTFGSSSSLQSRPFHLDAVSGSSFFGQSRTGRARLTPRTARANRNGAVGVTAEADYYADLGIGRSADAADIKNAFRQKARKMHPDVNDAPDAQEQFQTIQQAYEVLSDPQKKAMYDQFGEAGVKGAAGAGGAGFSDFGDFSPFGDIFETFFGGGGGMGGGAGGRRRQSGPQQGDDLRLDLEIDFKQAIFGGDEKIRISHLETCNTCEGSGMKPGTKPRTCTQCSGTGVVTQVARTPLGMLQQQMACPACQGTGEIIDEFCGTCAGRGRMQKSKQLMITIPPGVDSGSRLRIRKEGDAGPKGGPPGDLYIFLTVKPSNDFKRDGSDIYSNVKVSYVDAILGTEVKVPTVDGEVTVKIAAGTQPESVMKLAEKGVPKLGSKDKRGAHFLTVKVDIPTSVKKEEREMLEKLRKGAAVGGKGFFKR